MTLLTAGPEGLYLCGYTEKSLARETDNQIRSAGISDFNRYEFSRPARKADCEEPMKISRISALIPLPFSNLRYEHDFSSAEARRSDES